ncbi:hypothetical protein Dimus_006842 [Dionaea muscipula]
MHFPFHRNSLANDLFGEDMQLDDMERKLHDSKFKLARIRSRSNEKSFQNGMTGSSLKEVEFQQRSASPVQNLGDPSQYKHNSRPKLVIPEIPPPGPSQPTKFPVSEQRAENTSRAEADLPSSIHSDSPMQMKADKSYGMSPSKNSRQRAECSSRAEAHVPSSRHSDSPMKMRAEKSYGMSPPNQEVNRSQNTGTKRKIECREHKELIRLVSTTSSPRLIRCHSSIHIPSQHKRKLKSLSLCPINDKLFITSALDGIVNLWQLQARGSGATLLSSTECLSPKQRKWPEDIAWHPTGNMLFAVYSGDVGDNQISILDLNKTHGKDRVTFLDEKPHFKGLINSILFMPWDDDHDVYFATGGCDHTVLLWKGCENNIWKPTVLHRNLHSSAVMGVAGLRQKKIVMSAGADKRIIGYDVVAGRIDYKYQIETRCMSVLPNPCDFNLFMVQTGAPQRQLRLYDIRLRQAELHAFGWKQESSESQSALINQSWSPDGLYITSGSADPTIHIFDIRYNANRPCQSVQAHQKRVFKAMWHSSVPVLTSISSDLNIGLHQIQ